MSHNVAVTGSICIPWSSLVRLDLNSVTSHCLHDLDNINISSSAPGHTLLFMSHNTFLKVTSKFLKGCLHMLMTLLHQQYLATVLLMSYNNGTLFDISWQCILLGYKCLHGHYNNQVTLTLSSHTFYLHHTVMLWQGTCTFPDTNFPSTRFCIIRLLSCSAMIILSCQYYLKSHNQSTFITQHCCARKKYIQLYICLP